MHDIYSKFEKFINSGAKILDLGCGSGRDSKYFAEKGYDVIALDASEAMCKITKEYAKVNTILGKIEEIELISKYDAVWACASLLHVEEDALESVIKKLIMCLNDSGIIYASWKYGEKNSVIDGKYYMNMTESRLKNILKNVENCQLVEVWITEEKRTESRISWFNAIIQNR